MGNTAPPWDTIDQLLGDPAPASSENKFKQAVNDMTPLKGKTALVVDTALATRRALQEQLSQLGARSVIFASSVTEVEQQLAARELSLIICEYQLEGDRNGQQLLEDLRVNKRLAWYTAFMMVTGERSYSNVVSVAEFEPDDYLIKPFTASTLSERVVRIFNRKSRLAEAYKSMFEERYELLPPLCSNLVKEFPQYKNELDRMRIESYFRREDYMQTEKELNEGLARNPRPWMNLLMAKVQMERKRFDEANDLLRTVTRDNPEYIAAGDLFADCLWEQNRPEEAIEVIERMGAKALGSTTRLRKLADLSVRVGDDTRCKTYLNRVIDRSRGSGMSQINDYLLLSKIYVKEGKHDEAEKLAAKMRAAVNSTELELARSMMAIQKEIADGQTARAIDRLNAFFEQHEGTLDNKEPETLTNILEMCFAVKMDTKGYDLARKISKLKPTKGVLDRIKAAIAETKKS